MLAEPTWRCPPSARAPVSGCRPRSSLHAASRRLPFNPPVVPVPKPLVRAISTHSADLFGQTLTWRWSGEGWCAKFLRPPQGLLISQADSSRVPRPSGQEAAPSGAVSNALMFPGPSARPAGGDKDLEKLEKPQGLKSEPCATLALGSAIPQRDTDILLVLGRSR